MSELANRSVALEDVVGPGAHELVERLADASGWAARFATLIDRALTARLAAAPPGEPGTRWALGRIEATGGRVRAGHLARELGWSHRRLIARFRDDIGLPPKAVARIVRFERVRRVLDGEPAMGLAQAAATCGFADQAHLAREARDLVGDDAHGPAGGGRHSRPRPPAGRLLGSPPHVEPAPRSHRHDRQRRLPIVPYRDPRAAIAWLGAAFGARALMVHPPEPDLPVEHAELQVGAGVVMVSDTGRAGENPFRLPDRPLCRRGRSRGSARGPWGAGAEIVRGLTDQDHGSREFAARDCDGNVWSFWHLPPGVARGVRESLKEGSPPPVTSGRDHSEAAPQAAGLGLVPRLPLLGLVRFLAHDLRAPLFALSAALLANMEIVSGRRRSDGSCWRWWAPARSRWRSTA